MRRDYKYLWAVIEISPTRTFLGDPDFDNIMQVYGCREGARRAKREYDSLYPYDEHRVIKVDIVIPGE